MRRHRQQRKGSKRPKAGWWMAGLPSRRRAWQAAISPGEAHAAVEPGIPEWDLLRASARAPIRLVSASLREREPPELKHLSRGRKRKQHAMPGVGATETGRGQTEPCGEEPQGMWSIGPGHPLAGRAEVPWNGPP